MGKKHQNAAAARARAARWRTQAVNNLNSEPPSPFQWPGHEDAEPHDIIVIESDSCSECDYTGGVGVNNSDSDTPENSDWETDLTGDSLSELSGDELEQNLCMLQTESEPDSELPTKPTAFEKIATGASMAAWKRAERNRGLGYNGQSQRTHERRAQQARAAAKERENAKKSYVS